MLPGNQGQAVPRGQGATASWQQPLRRCDGHPGPSGEREGFEAALEEKGLALLQGHWSTSFCAAAAQGLVIYPATVRGAVSLENTMMLCALQSVSEELTPPQEA